MVQEQHRYELDELVSRFQKDQQLLEGRLREATSGLYIMNISKAR